MGQGTTEVKDERQHHDRQADRDAHDDHVGNVQEPAEGPENEGHPLRGEVRHACGRRTCQPQEPRLRTACQEGRTRAERRRHRHDRLPLGPKAEQGSYPETCRL